MSRPRTPLGPRSATSRAADHRAPQPVANNSPAGATSIGLTGIYNVEGGHDACAEAGYEMEK